MTRTYTQLNRNYVPQIPDALAIARKRTSNFYKFLEAQGHKSFIRIGIE